MPDNQTFSWLVPASITVALAIGTAIGWFVRKRFERKWARIDRREEREEERQEAALQEQLKLLRHINEELHPKWSWFLGHTDARDLKNAVPLANEVSDWLEKHSAYFPEEIRLALVSLSQTPLILAIGNRERWLGLAHAQEEFLWKAVREYQREVERKLGLKSDVN